MTRLEPPALPSIARRLRWPGTVVAVFGRGAGELALRLARRARERGADARAVRVELRHREGHDVSGERDLVIACAPEALLAALSTVEDHAALTIGAGAAFAAAMESDLAVWIRAGESLVSLPEPERALAAEARLVLEEPRPGVADALADRLVGAGPAAARGL